VISFSDGEQLRSNPKTTLSFPTLATGEFVKNNITGGFLSTFTSWGPTNELAIKPNVASPGGIIYSTFPLALGGFVIDQGTSMATPYISGVTALYLSVKGQTSALKMKDLMTITANPIDWNDGFTTTVGVKAPVAQQGGGLVDAFRFLTATTQISPSLIELNVYPVKQTHLISRIPSISKGVTSSLSQITEPNLLLTNLRVSMPRQRILFKALANLSQLSHHHWTNRHLSPLFCLPMFLS
jgi:subtilisin family serine protease